MIKRFLTKMPRQINAGGVVYSIEGARTISYHMLKQKQSKTTTKKNKQKSPQKLPKPGNKIT